MPMSREPYTDLAGGWGYVHLQHPGQSNFIATGMGIEVGRRKLERTLMNMEGLKEV